jgi:signal transduction histidine kinase
VVTGCWSDKNMITPGELVLALVGISSISTLGFFYQWGRASGARRESSELNANLKAADEKYTAASSRGEQLARECQILETRLAAARVDLQHERNALHQARDALAKEQKALQGERDKMEVLKNYVSSRPTRIQHDVSSRLNVISLRIQESIKSKVLRNALVREIQVITEKIELHVSKDIADFVQTRREEKEERGETADGLSIWEIIEHVVAIENYSNVRFDRQEDMTLEGQWVHWELLLTHLISNAVDYASRVDGEVRIAVFPDGVGRASIEITNDGEHIPEENIDRVFEMGFTTKPSGTGMGLYIAQQIAGGLGGRLERPENLWVKKSLLPFRKKTTAVKFKISNLPVFSDDEPSEVGEERVA